MDPQACLQRIIDAHEAIKPIPYGSVDLGVQQEHITAAFEDLAEWLRKGGFPPRASGPIFGTGPRAIGYPGMTRNSLPRYEPHNIKHLRSSMGRHRYAIMVADPNDHECHAWVMVEYKLNDEINRWPFAT